MHETKKRRFFRNLLLLMVSFHIPQIQFKYALAKMKINHLQFIYISTNPTQSQCIILSGFNNNQFLIVTALLVCLVTTSTCFFFFFSFFLSDNSGELHSDQLHVVKHTIQQSSLLIKLLQATNPSHQNQLLGNPEACHP